MSETGQFQSSHAFTNINTSDIESINPNTGSLNVRISVVKLAGVAPSIDLNVTLFYTPGSQGIFGLPKNWSLDIPYVLGGKSVTTGGRTFAIDHAWADAKGHKSGLRYVNNHGITFRAHLPPKALPSGRAGKYEWSLKHPDGSVDYFDGFGRPAERWDVHGNHVVYEYQPPAQGGTDLRTTRLRSIQDSWGQIVEVKYGLSDDLRFSFPDGGQSVINYSAGGVGSFVDAEGLRTRFEYTIVQGQSQLHTITYPNGLVSRFKYKALDFLDFDGKRHAFYAVEERAQYDSEKVLLGKLLYRYGPKNGHTFTGAAIGVKLGGAKDGLMDTGSNYSYEVQRSSIDAHNNEVSRSSTWFNNLHLQTKIVRYSRTEHGKFQEAQVSKMTYPTSPDQRARSAAYNAPTSTETFYSIGNDAMAPLRRTTSEYNDFCLPLSTTDELYSGAAGGYVKQATVLNVYKQTRLDTMQATKTSQKDEVSQFEQISENILTADEKNIASTSITFKEGTAPSRSWTRKAFEYDAKGRITSETLSWLPGASVPGDSVESTTTKTRYTYGSGKLTVAKLDAFGNTTTSQHDLRKPGGPVTLTRLPLGETETVEFDRIGREISRTDALGNKTATKHVVGPRGSSVTTTSPMGYVQTTTLDVLDREVEASDNGDETGGRPRTRVLSKKVYDIQSRVVEEVDRLGLRTAYKYDDLDRPIEITDPKGNAVTYTYLSGGLEIRQALNGSPRSIIHMNARSEPISIVHHPDSDVGSNEHSLQEEHAYDGRGNIIAKTWSDIHTSGNSHKREEELTVFGVNGTITTQTTIGHTAAGADKVQRSFTYDIFGNVYTYLKDTSYSDGRHFSHPGPIDIFDKANKLVTSRNQLGREEHRAYDTDARLSQLTRLDGSKVQYAYDGAGRLNQTTYPSSGRSLRTYDADGRLVKVSQAGEDVAYTYSLDGTEVGVRYSDGKAQTRLLDAFGRVVEETDAVGNTTKTAFDSYGNVTSRSNGGEEIKYRYGPSKHTKMQLLSTQQSGQASATTSYAYDGFGRVRKTTVEYGRSGKLLMDTTQTHDYKGRVTAMTTVSELVKELESKRVLEYDGLGQLIRDTRSGESGRGEEATTYKYDGNSNVVVADINGTRSTSSFNAIDQRTDAGFGYDANGRLIRDPKGNEYKFDDRDRLTSVSSSGQSSTYGYAPDDYLSGYKDDTQSANLYFDGGVANAISFSSDGTREETSILSDAISDRPLSTIGKKSTTGQAKTRYLVNQLGSTVAVVSNPDHSSADQESHYIPKSYDAYGAPRHSSASASSSAVDASSLLGFASEFTSPVGDIVYLRARHYNPHLKTFLSMDPRIPGSDRVTENRYAYCGGDPVNRIDPTGRSWSWLEDHPVLTTIIGLTVGLIVGVGTGLAVEAAIGWGIAALSSSFGIEIAAAVPAWAIAVGTQFIAGAAGGLVGGMAAVGATGDFGSYTWATAGLDFLGGGLGAVTALGARPFIRKAFNSPRMAWTNRVGTRMRNLSKWAGRKGAGKVVTLSITKGIPALEKAFAGVGMGVAVGLEEAKDWAHPVLKLQSEGLILHRVKRINFEKCGLGYGG